MKKLIAIFFCMGLMTACNSESSKKHTPSGAAKVEVSQTNESATPTDMVTAPPSSAAASNTQSGTDSHSELRRKVQIMQQRLPIKMYGMDLTDLKFENNTIYYTYIFTDKNITSKNASAEQMKNTLLMLCDRPDSKAFILDGNAFMYTYHFQDGSKVELRISAKDCQ